MSAASVILHSATAAEIRRLRWAGQLCFKSCCHLSQGAKLQHGCAAVEETWRRSYKLWKKEREMNENREKTKDSTRTENMAEQQCHQGVLASSAHSWSAAQVHLSSWKLKSFDRYTHVDFESIWKHASERRLNIDSERHGIFFTWKTARVAKLGAS